MTSLFRYLVMAVFLFSAACAPAQMSFPLVPGPDLAEQTDVVVTVPLSERTRMESYAQKMADEADAELLAIWPLQAIGVICYVFRSRTSDAATLAARMAENPEVVTAEQLRDYRTLAPDYRDELLPVQNAMLSLGVPEAHDRTRGAGVSIAVIDTGVDLSHPDLVARDLEYRDFVQMDDSRDAERHGTAIAALIGADASNGVGMVGIAPEATLLPLRACWEDNTTREGRCNSFTLARALNFALLSGAEIMNLSLGGPPDPLLERLVDQALSEGRIVVAAGGPANPFPASMAGVIAVSDIPRQGHITAPGRDVLSATLNGGYDFFSGSSISTAHVSGLTALYLSAQSGVDTSINYEMLVSDTCSMVGADCN